MSCHPESNQEPDSLSFNVIYHLFSKQLLLKLSLYEYCLGLDYFTFHVNSRRNLFYRKTHSSSTLPLNFLPSSQRRLASGVRQGQLCPPTLCRRLARLSRFYIHRHIRKKGGKLQISQRVFQGKSFTFSLHILYSYPFLSGRCILSKSIPSFPFLLAPRIHSANPTSPQILQQPAILTTILMTLPLTWSVTSSPPLP